MLSAMAHGETQQAGTIAEALLPTIAGLDEERDSPESGRQPIRTADGEPPLAPRYSRSQREDRLDLDGDAGREGGRADGAPRGEAGVAE